MLRFAQLHSLSYAVGSEPSNSKSRNFSLDGNRGEIPAGRKPRGVWPPAWGASGLQRFVLPLCLAVRLPAFYFCC